MKQHSSVAFALASRLAFSAVTLGPLAVAATLAACSASSSTPIPGAAPTEPAPAEAEPGGHVPEAPPSAAPTSTSPTKPEAPKDAGSDGDDDAANDAPAPPPPPPEDARINELYVDHDSVGDVAEYVELRAAPGTPVGGLRLRIVRAGGRVTEVPVGRTDDLVGPTGLWVVGGTDVRADPARVDFQPDPNAWGLDNTAGAVQLVSGAAKQLVDAVAYTTNVDAGRPAVSQGEGKPVLVPTPRLRAFGRSTGAADTNDNHADFCTMAQTPGYPQAACE